MNGEERELAERLRRWRLILGPDSEEELSGLSAYDQKLDQVLTALYQEQNSGVSSARNAGLGGSAPRVARWLGDIREFFPSNVVRVMQKDAMDRLGLEQMLLEPEMLETVEPDVHLVGTLLSLNHVIPSKTKETARLVVRKVVEELEKKLENPLRQAISGSLNRSVKNRRPRHSEIDWNRTIRANLKHYQPDYQTVIPVDRIGWGRKQSSLKDIILAVDQSGSMASSVVYSSICAAVMASIRAVNTNLVVFDTSVVDLTEKLSDPVDVLFGTQLGGGTDINRAVAYCQGLVRRPSDTIFILISDLYEGGVEKELVKRMGSLVASGATVITLLALSDEGAPMFDQTLAAKLTALGSPSFAVTPEIFPDLMAAAIQKQDIQSWAANNQIKVES